jgi:hypothetical protein
LNPDLQNILVRKQIIDDIKSHENVKRKAESLKSYEIYNDNAKPYVYEKLCHQLSQATANKMPVVSNLNVAKAVVNKEAQIYTDEPVRTYEDISAADELVLKEAYQDFGFNTILAKSNRYYKLRNQTFLQVVPKYGKLKLRVLHAHNLDIIPDADDPEIAFAYIVSSFDKTTYLQAGQDNVNQKTADTDDYKKMSERYQVTTKEITFTMNGKGDLVDELIANPIQTIPFIDVSKDKDFEFFIRIGQALTDFTVDFNVAWSDLLNVSRLQGYSIGVISGDPELKPESLDISANNIIFLPLNPSNPNSKLEFDFKSPTPNIEATLKAIDSLVTTFLSTRGVDSKSVSSSSQGQNYSSALERLMAMLDQFRASKEDFDLYKTVEYQLHEITTKYLSLLSSTKFLDPKYNVSLGVVNSKLNIQFAKPEIIETKSESLDNAKKKIELGISDKVNALIEVEGLNENLALEKIEAIENRKIELITKTMQSGQDASKTALNGSQVTSLVEIVSKVAAGLLPFDAAQSMITAAFNVTDEQALEILGQAGKSFKIDPAQIESKPKF